MAAHPAGDRASVLVAGFSNGRRGMGCSLQHIRVKGSRMARPEVVPRPHEEGGESRGGTASLQGTQGVRDTVCRQATGNSRHLGVGTHSGEQNMCRGFRTRRGTCCPHHAQRTAMGGMCMLWPTCSFMSGAGHMARATPLQGGCVPGGATVHITSLVTAQTHSRTTP